MPSLIRFLITLIFLGGLVFAGMFALVAFVEPMPKEVSQRIPSRDLLGDTDTARPGANLPQPNITSGDSDAQ